MTVRTNKISFVSGNGAPNGVTSGLEVLEQNGEIRLQGGNVRVANALSVDGNFTMGDAATDLLTVNSILGNSGAGNVHLSTLTGSFTSPTGANTLSGDVTVSANKQFTAASGSGNFTLSGMTGSFSTPTGAVTIGTGAITLSGDSTIAANKQFTAASGSGNFTLSGMTGSFNTPTGAVTIGTGSVTISGNANIATGKKLNGVDADSVLVNNVILPQTLFADMHAQAAAEQVDQYFFIADAAYQVTGAREIHTTAESTASTLYVQVRKNQGTNGPATGSGLLANIAGSGFDLKGTAATGSVGSLIPTTADLQLAAGDRLGADFSASATELVGTHITVTLKRI